MYAVDFDLHIGLATYVPFLSLSNYNKLHTNEPIMGCQYNEITHTNAHIRYLFARIKRFGQYFALNLNIVCYSLIVFI